MKQICNSCKKEKDLSQFKNAKARKNGKTTQCKECIERKERELNKKSKTYFLYHGSAPKLRKQFGYSLDYMKNWVIKQWEIVKANPQYADTFVEEKQEAVEIPKEVAELQAQKAKEAQETKEPAKPTKRTAKKPVKKISEK